MVLELRAADRAALCYRLDPDRPLLIGRDEEADIRVEDDPLVSRRHAVVRAAGDGLAVEVLPEAANPVFFHGATARAFALPAGEHFVIGRTRFLLRGDEAEATPPPEASPVDRRTLTADELRRPEVDGDRLRLLDLLELPEILSSKTPTEYFLHLAGLLRIATGAAEADVLAADGRLLARDATSATAGPAGRSRSLIREALAAAPRPVLYSWTHPDPGRAATLVAGTDWAICAAAAVSGETSVLFYVSGADALAAVPGRLVERARFVGLVADMVARTLAVRRLELKQERLQRFFSGAVITKIVSSADETELAPRLATATVMFFDLRGFSRKTEGENAKILAYSGELRRVMTAMTAEIFREHGTVLQYMGDGLLACWNVPVADGAHVDRACRAALAMAAALDRIGDGWHCGIGLATGEVVAGSLGSEQVFSYSVMGDVVNRTSRVEGITKVVESPVLVTREVAELMSPGVASVVRIGRFQPAGMEAPLDLYELSAAGDDGGRSDVFGRGLAAFEAGKWEEAYGLLSTLGPEDRPARYLMALAEDHRRHAPRLWSGVIELTGK